MGESLHQYSPITESSVPGPPYRWVTDNLLQRSVYINQFMNITTQMLSGPLRIKKIFGLWDSVFHTGNLITCHASPSPRQTMWISVPRQSCCISDYSFHLPSVAANSSYRAWARTFTTKEWDFFLDQWKRFLAWKTLPSISIDLCHVNVMNTALFMYVEHSKDRYVCLQQTFSLQ